VARQESILLFGEGKTEAVFLSHLRTVYAGRIQARVKRDSRLARRAGIHESLTRIHKVIGKNRRAHFGRTPSDFRTTPPESNSPRNRWGFLKELLS